MDTQLPQEVSNLIERFERNQQFFCHKSKSGTFTSYHINRMPWSACVAPTPVLPRMAQSNGSITWVPPILRKHPRRSVQTGTRYIGSTDGYVHAFH